MQIRCATCGWQGEAIPNAPCPDCGMPLGQAKAAPKPAPPAAPIPLTRGAPPAPIPLTRAPAAPIPLSKPAAPAAVACSNCGTPIPAGFRFCGACGAPAPGAAPPPPKAPPPPAIRAQVVVVAPDGTDAGAYNLAHPVSVGRQQGEITFPEDEHVSQSHCTFETRGDKVWVVDHGSINGVFIALRGERPLEMGGQVRLGRQVVRLEPMPEPVTDGEIPVWGSPDPGYVARLVQQFEGGGEGDIYPLKEGENAVGRGAGDITFPKDGYVSSRHGVVTVKNGKITVRDIGSANGTFWKVMGEGQLDQGDLVLIGDQLLRVDIG